MKKTTILTSLFLVTLLLGCENKNEEFSKNRKENIVVEKENPYLNKLSKSNAALVMVDFLTGFDPGLKTIDKNLYNHNVTALAKIGTIFNLPTVVLGDEGGFRGEFYPLLKKILPNAPRIGRHTPSAWSEKAFQDFIKNSGRKKIIIGGISLDNCTLQTSLDLLKNGYEVYVVVDASGTDEKLVEQAAMMRLTQAGAVMVSWGSIAGEIMEDWQSPEGEAVGKLYQDHSAWNGELKTIER